MRLRSYAHLMQMEEQEPWKDLRLHSSASNPARKLRSENLLRPQERVLPMSMSPEAYLAALVPGESMRPGACT